MVLIKRVPGALAAALLLLSAACITTGPAVRLSAATPVTVALVYDETETRGSGPVPEAVRARVEAALAERNLTPVYLGGADGFVDAFRTVRATPRRLALMKEQAGESDLLLLVETRVEYYSQIAGRFRWSVDARVSVAPTDDLSLTATRDATLGAFLQFNHQREPAALSEVAGQIGDRVESLVDDYLADAGLGDTEHAAVTGDAAAEEAASPGPRRRGGRSSWRPAPPPVDDGIYFVLIDRFANGSLENDGAVDPDDPAAFHGGDLQGLTDRLDWIASLGVKTIWLSPIYAARGGIFHGHGAFHGYWVQDHFQAWERLGGEDALTKLSEAVHARGMRLYLDVVLNHVDYDSALEREKPHWFHPNGPITDWNDPKQLVSYQVHGLPDLDQSNPEVYRYLVDSSRSWIDRARADGFRLDAVKHVPLSFWRRFNAEMKAYAGPHFRTLGEDLTGDVSQIARTRREGRFDALFDFPLHFALVDVFCKDAPVGRLASVLSADRLHEDPSGLVTLLDNHDLPRIASACGEDLGRVSRALTVQFLMRGVPSIMYGTEVGLTGATEPENRADMRFDAGHPLRALVTRLFALRSAHPALTRGATRLLSVNGGVLALARVTGDEAVVVAANLGAAAARVALPEALLGGAAVREVRLGVDATGAVGGAVGERGDAVGEGGVATGEGGLLSYGASPLDGAALEVPAGAVRVLVLTPKAPGAYARLAESGTTTRPGAPVEIPIRVDAAPAKAGDTVLLIGSAPEIGAWDPQRAVALTRDGDGFRGTVKVPSGVSMAYKLAIRRADGTVDWQQGQDGHLLVMGPPAKQRIALSWRDGGK